MGVRDWMERRRVERIRRHIRASAQPGWDPGLTWPSPDAPKPAPPAEDSPPPEPPPRGS